MAHKDGPQGYITAAGKCVAGECIKGECVMKLRASESTIQRLEPRKVFSAGHMASTNLSLKLVAAFMRVIEVNDEYHYSYPYNDIQGCL